MNYLKFLANIEFASLKTEWWYVGVVETILCTWLLEFKVLTTEVTTLLFDDVLLLLWWDFEGVAVVNVDGMVVKDGVDGGGG